MVLFFLCLPIAPALATEKITIQNAQGFLQETTKPTGIKESDLATGSGKLVKRLLAGVSIVFFGLMVYAGFLWMTAQGNEDQVTTARNTIIASIIGLVLVLGAYAATTFIVNRLQTPVGPPGGPAAGPAEAGSGCCQDRVGAFVWACRITTQDQCKRAGETCDNSDQYCAASDWKFDPDFQIWDNCRTLCE